MTKKEKLIFVGVLLAGFLLRAFSLNWDQGHAFHPDERMIIMITQRIHWPEKLSLTSFLDPNSPLNPKFFAYGSFPLYFLKFIAWLISRAFGEKWLSYHYLFATGRVLSVFFDLSSIWLIWKIGRKIFSPMVALWATFFYTSSVFPIQLSHFYAVDVSLNFFILLTLFSLIRLYERPSLKRASIAGISFGLALATKISATVLVASIGTALAIDLFLIFNKRQREILAPWWKKILLIIKRSNKKSLFRTILKQVFGWGLVVSIYTGLVFIIFEPYALIDWPTFWQQINEQQRMTKNAYTFPYTLQYVGTIPYLYQIKNFLFWGLGLGLGIWALISAVCYLVDLGKRLLVKGDYEHEAEEIIVAVFFLTYFLVIGRFAVKFMRYFLPLYPIFILYAVNFAYQAKNKIRFKIWLTLAGISIVLHLLWLFSFLAIYTKPHSRVQADQWIAQNLPVGATIAIKHWDDRLPLSNQEKYQFVEMPMYENDNSPTKWEQVEANLKAADYLILASNRLYVPLQKLGDCQEFKICYPKTSCYYQDLFSGKLGFQKVAEFSSYPTVPFTNYQIIDDSADESFTVYDHPKVVIFQKIKTPKS